MAKGTLKITDFVFQPCGHGHFFVSYVSPSTGAVHKVKTDNMRLIDATKNSEAPLKKDLVILFRLCLFKKSV